MKASKITIAKECIEAMIFLNIPTENFLTMKNSLGGLIQLHDYLAREMEYHLPV